MGPTEEKQETGCDSLYDSLVTAYLVVLRQTQQVAVLHVHQVIGLREKGHVREGSNKKSCFDKHAQRQAFLGRPKKKKLKGKNSSFEKTQAYFQKTQGILQKHSIQPTQRKTFLV